MENFVFFCSQVIHQHFFNFFYDRQFKKDYALNFMISSTHSNLTYGCGFSDNIFKIPAVINKAQTYVKTQIQR